MESASQYTANRYKFCQPGLANSGNRAICQILPEPDKFSQAAIYVPETNWRGNLARQLYGDSTSAVAPTVPQYSQTICMWPMGLSLHFKPQLKEANL